MTSDAFFETLEKQLQNGLPFVVYSKSNDLHLKALLQKDASVNYCNDYSESGFVMAPFDANEKAVLIPISQSECIETSDLKSIKKVPAIGSERKPSGKKTHKKLIKKGIKATQFGGLKKVVLSRRESINTENTSTIQLFKNLLYFYQDAFAYLWFHPEVGLWLGATPETLVKVNGRQLNTMALAGTQVLVDFSHVVWGTKEREEQQFVVDYITSNLKPNVDKLLVDKLETIKAGNLLHLQTKIRATLKTNINNLKQIIDSLHPTPAICGLPRDKAMQFILKHEGYNREFYTGFLGELNMKTTTSRNRKKRNVENSAYQTIKAVTNLYVNLRCMQIKNDIAHIYVGGGITKDSIAKYEWRETVNKAKTMKKVL